MHTPTVTKLFCLLLITFAIHQWSGTLLAEAPEPESVHLYTPRGIEPFIGEIIMFAGNFEPRGWAFCDGRLLPIAQNQALFSILGTTYGGDGRTTFALPDLRGRVPVHAGQGPGLSSYQLGQQGGQESVTLTPAQLPAHSHAASAAIHAGASIGLTNTATNNVLAHQTRGDVFPTVYSNTQNVTTLRADAATVTVDLTGGNQAHENRMPYTAVNYIIAVQGIFPSRN